MSMCLCYVFSLCTFALTYLWPMYENNFSEKLPTSFIEHWQSCFFLGMDKKMSLAIFSSVKVELGIRYCIVVMTLTCGDDPVIVLPVNRTFWYYMFDVSWRKTAYLIMSWKRVTVWVYYENFVYRLFKTVQTVQKYASRQRNRLYLNYARTFQRFVLCISAEILDFFFFQSYNK